MSDLHSLPENDTQAPADGFLFDDWNLTEKSPVEETAPFDGKIIARMPDLGSNSFAKNTKNSKSLPELSAIWNRLFQSLSASIQGKIPESVRTFAGTRQQFFQRITVFGGVFLLCGVGLLVLDQSDKEPTVVTTLSVNVADIVPENTEPPAIVVLAPAKQESAFSPISLPESGTILSNSAIPVADFAAVQNSVTSSAGQVDLLENRPATQSYSPFGVKQQSEGLPPSPDVAAVPPPMPPVAVAMSPMSPIPVSPTPVSPMSMPVSPYEQQLGVQTSPPVRPPVDPFIQANSPPNHPPIPPGMMPMHERLENMMTAPPQNNAPRSASAAPPYPPFVAVQGGAPVNLPNNQGISYNQNGHYGSQSAPPNYAPQSNMPIPSGVSTLQPQPGYYPQPHGAVGQNPAGNFHPTVPPAYHRIY